MKLTKEQIDGLELCLSPQEWTEKCKQIKAASPSGVEYPEDWGEKVILSGLVERVHARWGKPMFTVTTFDGEK